MWDSQDTDPQIVLKKRWALPIGWFLLLAAPLLLAILLLKIATGEDELGATVLIAVVPVLALVGICLAGSTTTVTFHRYDSTTVIGGFIPLFMWWRRTKCISRETAITAIVTSVAGTELSDTLYRVEVITESGDTFVLFADNNSEPVNDLAIKIRQWGGLEG